MGCSTVLIQSPHLRTYQSLTVLPLLNCVLKTPNKVSPLTVLTSYLLQQGRSLEIEHMGAAVCHHLHCPMPR